MQTLDWTQVQTFLAVAETGSLSAAARRLSISQPTAGRHVQQLEQQLRGELFQRAARGQTLTELGAQLVNHARDMAASEARMRLIAEGEGAQIKGTVRITASVVVSHFLLPDIIATIRRAEPDIEIELTPSDTSENLLFREADIAVRMYRPTQLDVVARHIADQPLGIYAANSLLDRHKEPKTLEDFFALGTVGFDTSDLIIRGMRDLGFPAKREDFAVRCDDQAVFWRLIVAGCGAGAMQRRIGDAEPRVRRILHDFALPPLPVWLVTPQALRHTPRLRRVWDHLAEGLRRIS